MNCLLRDLPWNPLQGRFATAPNLFNNRDEEAFYEPPKILYLKMNLLNGSRDLVFTANYLVCSGWVATDRKGLQAYIDELVQLGVPAPGGFPST
jgi:hypothetical protein